MENTSSFNEPPDLEVGSTEGPSDLILNFKGNKIPVHKSVLIEASEYFRDLLTKDFKEADSNEIIIGCDVDEEIFQAIINYIYTDEIEFSTSNVEDISKAARYFKLENLTKSSFDFKVKFFEWILKDESFLDWNLSSIQKVLQSDRVVVSNEKKMLLFATKWMKYDFVNRCKSAVELLQNVRFSHMNDKERGEIAQENNQVVFGIPHKLLSRPTPLRVYHKGIYMLGDPSREATNARQKINFQRYCPVDGTVKDLAPAPDTSGRDWKLSEHNERIYIFGKRPDNSNQVYEYDSMLDSWNTVKIDVRAIGNNITGFVYCLFERVLYAFVVFGDRMSGEAMVKAYYLRDNNWIVNDQSDTMLGGNSGSTKASNPASSGSLFGNSGSTRASNQSGSGFLLVDGNKTRASNQNGFFGSTPPDSISLSNPTVCGDSIYVIPSKQTRLLRYKPATDEWTEVPCPHNLTDYQVVAYNEKLLFHCEENGRLIVLDTNANDYTEYFCPGRRGDSTRSSLITLYNDSIYFIPHMDSSRRVVNGIHCIDVQRFGGSFLDEAISQVEPPLPVLKTTLDYVRHVASIQQN